MSLWTVRLPEFRHCDFDSYSCFREFDLHIYSHFATAIFTLIRISVTLTFETVLISSLSGFVGLEVACWPLVPKFAGSIPAEAFGFLRVNKNPQHVGGHGCLSVVIVVCCQVEVSVTN